jgi:hypothetical protein
MLIGTEERLVFDAWCLRAALPQGSRPEANRIAVTGEPDEAKRLG